MSCLHEILAISNSLGSVNHQVYVRPTPIAQPLEPEPHSAFHPRLHRDTMSTATGNPLPIASEKPYGDDSAPEVDSDAGASGDSSGNSVNISQGGIIAIIVVVVVVVILGGMYSEPPLDPQNCLPRLCVNLLQSLLPPCFISPRSGSGISKTRSGNQPARLSPLSHPDDQNSRAQSRTHPTELAQSSTMYHQRHDCDLRTLRRDWPRQRRSERSGSGGDEERGPRALQLV